MSDYISREAAIALLKKWADGYSYIETPTEDAINEFNAIPAADVRPVVYGEWIGVDCSYWRHAAWGAYPVKRIRYKCSVCGRIENQKEPFCNCGAEMTGGADNG